MSEFKEEHNVEGGYTESLACSQILFFSDMLSAYYVGCINLNALQTNSTIIAKTINPDQT